jgi:hypothetical protein
MSRITEHLIEILDQNARHPLAVLPVAKSMVRRSGLSPPTAETLAAVVALSRRARRAGLVNGAQSPVSPAQLTFVVDGQTAEAGPSFSSFARLDAQEVRRVERCRRPVLGR